MPGGVASDETNVYWTNATSSDGGPLFLDELVIKAEPGSSSETVLATVTGYLGQVIPGDVAVQGGNVYWDDNEVIGQVPATGGTQSYLATFGAGGYGLWLTADRIYWIDPVPQIFSVLLTGGGFRIVVSPSIGVPLTMTVDVNNVYWGDDKSIYAMPLAGGAAITLATAPSSYPQEMAVDSSSVYWTTQSGAVMKVSLTGGSATTLASGQHYPDRIAIDANTVFWTNNSVHGDVMKIGKNGGGLTNIASNQNQPRALAVDSTHIYWINYGSGEVLSVPK